VRTGGEILRGAAAVPAVICAALLMSVVGARPAAAGVVGSLPDRVMSRAVMRVEGLSLDDTRGLPDSAAPATPIAFEGGGSPGLERKNPMAALLLSVAVPGLGELYTGNTARAKSFIAAEAGIWTGYAAFRVQENLRVADYEEYASIFAGIPEGSSGDYYQDVADYIRSEGADSYNEAIRAEARSLYPDDLDAQHAYLDAHGYFGSSSWQWESEARFEHYRELRHDAAVSRKNAFYMTGLAVLNRALSAVDSAWMARRHNMGRTGEPSARLYMSPDAAAGGVGSRVGLEISF
jgi:hypothetical protein